MTKQYQTQRFDTSALAVPEQVSVAMADVAEDIREGLLALAVGAGLQVMSALMDADVAALGRAARPTRPGPGETQRVAARLAGRTLTGTPTRRIRTESVPSYANPGVSRKTGSVKIPAQGPLYGTLDEVVYAPD